jgi:hypothetical protein
MAGTKGGGFIIAECAAGLGKGYGRRHADKAENILTNRLLRPSLPR